MANVKDVYINDAVRDILDLVAAQGNPIDRLRSIDTLTRLLREEVTAARDRAAHEAMEHHSAETVAREADVSVMSIHQWATRHRKAHDLPAWPRRKRFPPGQARSIEPISSR